MLELNPFSFSSRGVNCDNRVAYRGILRGADLHATNQPSHVDRNSKGIELRILVPEDKATLSSTPKNLDRWICPLILAKQEIVNPNYSLGAGRRGIFGLSIPESMLLIIIFKAVEGRRGCSEVLG